MEAKYCSDLGEQILKARPERIKLFPGHLTASQNKAQEYSWKHKNTSHPTRMGEQFKKKKITRPAKMEENRTQLILVMQKNCLSSLKNHEK